MPLVSKMLWIGLPFLTLSRRDVNSYTKAKNSIEPTNVFRGHTSVVGVCDILASLVSCLSCS